MGGKRTGTGQYLYRGIACLTLALLTACAPLRTMLAEREGQTHLRTMRQLARQGHFEELIRENHRILEQPQTARTVPADAALFSLGLAYADPSNPGRDYRMAREQFTRLLYDFPFSPFAEDARIWRGILDNDLLDEREGRAHLQRMQQLSQQGAFEAAERENRKILTSSPASPPADAALFSLGLLYADPANPRRDYRTALDFFSRLMADFPRSPFAEDGRIWDSILEDDVAGRERRAHLQRMRQLTRAGEFAAAVRENRQVLARTPKQPPADAALFSLGQIYADHRNPEMDYATARDYFRQLIGEFPRTPLAEGAHIWAGMLERQFAVQAGNSHLQRIQSFLRREDFDGALRENQRVLSRTPKQPPADAALFSIGRIHLHYANPKRDYKRAHATFIRLKREFPASPFAEEAKSWISLLETLEQALLVDVEIDRKQRH
ncbi:tetratricopeptide repeat protein [Trichlorobacter ammonificans]|uniref:Outer membrane protein assembly factor BamD n=1 Tax=Trichlorobacter ammonificans TaxID=2916410 RepID=A0ABN8HHZ8_9BACT|nr:tetratricopeptide repeat protein [Trichlorobacter ammonificans]CAH2030821.1 protein of unknown function [Trichlorobacter ammonificans]